MRQQQTHMLSSSQTNGHFLPSLPHCQSPPTQSRSHLPKEQPLDSIMRNNHNSSFKHHAINSPAEGDIDPQTKYHDDTNANNTRKNPPHEDIVERTSVTQKLVTGGLDKRKDRKSQARRYLVEGLNTSQLGSNGRRPQRSHSFNHNQATTLNQTRNHQSVSSKHPNRDMSPTERNVLNFNRLIRTIPKDDTSKVKRAIADWNELVLELNAEQYRRFSNQDRLSSLSDSSSDEDVPSPVHKHRHRKPLYASHSIFPPTKTETSQNGQTIKYNPFSLNFNFARYRPLTPNFLMELDKKKLSSRKKTQLWINQLEFQARPYHNQPSNTSKQEASTVAPDTSGGCPSPDGVATTSTVNRTLQRTESYGSTRTRQPIIQIPNKKQNNDFL